MRAAIVYSFAALAAALSPSTEARPTREPASIEVRYRTVAVDGVNVFYREAGRVDAPVVLLLHGFPSSSFMFRNVMTPLAQRYHVIAPDYPGFGQSDFPVATAYRYTFEKQMFRDTRVPALIVWGKYDVSLRRPARERISVTYRRPSFTGSTPGTSLWRRTMPRLQP